MGVIKIVSVIIHLILRVDKCIKTRSLCSQLIKHRKAPAPNNATVVTSVLHDAFPTLFNLL